MELKKYLSNLQFHTAPRDTRYILYNAVGEESKNESYLVSILILTLSRIQHRQVDDLVHEI